MRARAVAALIVVALLAAGCQGDPDEPRFRVPVVGPADIEVDTPELRAMKAAAGVAECEPGTGAPVAGGLPPITLPCFGGGPDVDLSGLRGPLVVNLWASWCAPCRHEMPILQEFWERYGDQVGVLGIDYEDVQSVAAMQLVADTGVTYPLLADPQADLSGADPVPNLRGLPFLMLVDADGRVVHRDYVEIKEVAALVELVTEHLGVDL
ncbi:TlpA family protein disulfide reductase [Nocardioides limicola]|uniref:TlpA family protein disulfide reductase n=1 Tax=Nocardioides limicola TaxID=2803368 RepID=UPI00193BFE5A|nr:TlpA disulfide reductase family protein [Nocardioides sp. DJM-14]